LGDIDKLLTQRNRRHERSRLMPTLPQRTFCEWSGTAFLFAAVLGSGSMAQNLGAGTSIHVRTTLNIDDRGAVPREEAKREGRPGRPAGAQGRGRVVRVDAGAAAAPRAQGGHATDAMTGTRRSRHLAPTVTLVLSGHFHHGCRASISQGLARNVSIRESPVAKSIHRNRAGRGQPRWR
jgi:hypothetical protein